MLYTITVIVVPVCATIGLTICCTGIEAADAMQL